MKRAAADYKARGIPDFPAEILGETWAVGHARQLLIARRFAAGIKTIAAGRGGGGLCEDCMMIRDNSSFDGYAVHGLVFVTMHGLVLF